MTTEERYKQAIKKIGGADGLLALPESAKHILRQTDDLETLTKMLESIAGESIPYGYED